jgi:hypothetical protein
LSRTANSTPLIAISRNLALCGELIWKVIPPNLFICGHPRGRETVDPESQDFLGARVNGHERVSCPSRSQRIIQKKCQRPRVRASELCRKEKRHVASVLNYCRFSNKYPVRQTFGTSALSSLGTPTHVANHVSRRTGRHLIFVESQTGWCQQAISTFGHQPQYLNLC